MFKKIEVGTMLNKLITMKSHQTDEYWAAVVARMEKAISRSEQNKDTPLFRTDYLE